jgi:hypothetical protein
MSRLETNPSAVADALHRKPYRTPTLHVFGRVAALTQAASGCAMSDNPACTPGAVNNMGPIPHLPRGSGHG